MIAKLGEFTQLKTLLIDVEINDNVYLAGRNIQIAINDEIDDFRLIDLFALKRLLLRKPSAAFREGMQMSGYVNPKYYDIIDRLC